MMSSVTQYPATLSVDYQDKPRDRVNVAFRLLMIIPVAIILSLISGGSYKYTIDHITYSAGNAGGIIILATVLMILFQQKYPKWWFDWNLALSRFSYRFISYLTLLRDEYPSTDEEQSVHLNLVYPNVKTDLNRWMPLFKWFLAIPHYILLAFLGFAAFICTIFAWFTIVFTGKYPKSLFDFVVGVLRWGLRVSAYSSLLITDIYPPFSLEP
ncbi:hypothetical protein B1772_06935 [Dehalococcoides mccartyi]|jgi:hypothetical protein|uniref:Membrane protein n=1 Tax=Dehalococcoides mccartyi TaxID=61435 RepID=A0A2J1DZE5_9CHLR|nr:MULTISPECIES: DUF4389 domain-containing protein [Dehalococcoides]AGG08529.1 hypothetical protein btf_1464 [Dehalococcoides mccartyi BTF08]AQX75202.1 hypothetical protein B1776_06625 [Dehalococcoides mccartyi]AQY73779.1 hypothetical protein B1772_06935 [Dehalococcoides mccartyi]OBW62774.1 MAG: hypothetical protein A9183_05565 [Dehalococcoides mccartyi]PKH47500.1 membrane protein [Dehalococcoides mccartyi]